VRLCPACSELIFASDGDACVNPKCPAHAPPALTAAPHPHTEQAQPPSAEPADAADGVRRRTPEVLQLAADAVRGFRVDTERERCRLPKGDDPFCWTCVISALQRIEDDLRAEADRKKHQAKQRLAAALDKYELEESLGLYRAPVETPKGGAQ